MIFRAFPLLILFAFALPVRADHPFLNWKNDPVCVRWVDSVYAGLSTEQRIGQCFMLPVFATPGDKRYNMKEVEEQIAKGQAGSVIFFKGAPSVQLYWSNRLQKANSLPILVALDAEWGLSMRVDSTILYPHQLTLGAIRDNTLIRRMGKQIGEECRRLGVHINFAPDIDLNNNPNNPVINDRSFGQDKFRVTLKGMEYQDGLLDAGVLPCIKHFPGHGDTDQDSHHTLPVIDKPRSSLDTLELFPFKAMIQEGAPAVMVAHLQVPALDSTNFTAVSVSRKIVTEFLKDSMGFDGLVFSDALNMKGVANFFRKGQLDSVAFIAGNDILVFSEDAPAGIEKIKAALDNQTITPEEFEYRIKKVLAYKYLLLRNQKIEQPSDNLNADLNSDSARGLCLSLYEEAMTLVDNAQNFFPLKTGVQKELAIIAIGNGDAPFFHEGLNHYVEADFIRIPSYATATQFTQWLDSVSRTYRSALISLHAMSRFASRNHGLYPEEVRFVNELARKMPVGLVVFGSPYSLPQFESCSNILVAYEDNDNAQMAAVNAVVGAIPVRGRLPVTSGKYQHGTGWVMEALGLLKWSIPGQAGYTQYDLRDLDDVMKEGIIAHAFPGGQLLAVKDGKVIWNKNYGNLTYEKQEPVNASVLYDIASITKIAATTLAVMKCHEQGKLHLEKTVADYLSLPEGNTIGRLKLKDILLHQAGLQAYIEFFKSTINRDGPLPQYYRNRPENGFEVQVADSLYLRNDYRDTIWNQICFTRVSSQPGYIYSDLDFYILWKIVEQITGKPLDQFCAEQFYQPMGLRTMGYHPLQRFPAERIAPTENDKTFRRQNVRGYVHDPGAAMMGGMAGHAGLFSNAFDLAAVMQMLLNHGRYNGRQLLDSLTIETFTSRSSNISRRGLGFDKPEPDPKKTSPCSESVSPLTFGHTGFTGTAAWADPKHQLIFIFLSNRIQPDAINPLLNNRNIRPRLQEILYRAHRPK